MARISFQRQQDVKVICGKVKSVTAVMKKKMELENAARVRLDAVKKSRMSSGISI